MHLSFDMGWKNISLNTENTVSNFRRHMQMLTQTALTGLVLYYSHYYFHPASGDGRSTAGGRDALV